MPRGGARLNSGRMSKKDKQQAVSRLSAQLLANQAWWENHSAKPISAAAGSAASAPVSASIGRSTAAAIFDAYAHHSSSTIANSTHPPQHMPAKPLKPPTPLKSPFAAPTAPITSDNPGDEFFGVSGGEYGSPPFRGLVNCGQTCWLNAVLQPVCQSPFLQAAAAHLQPSDGWTIGSAVSSMALQLRNCDASPSPLPLTPTAILAALPSIFPDAIRGKQEDAAEFYNYLLNGIASSPTTRSVDPLRDLSAGFCGESHTSQPHIAFVMLCCSVPLLSHTHCTVNFYLITNFARILLYFYRCD